MTPSTLTATIIIPTSIDRGPTLTLAVQSVLSQSVRSLEVFIIGDGVHDVTRAAARALENADPRVRFFDHPKHTRRGEPYRHEALQHARGRIVCYLCDRDLYLPDHLETMDGLLQAADFAHAPWVRVDEDGRFNPREAFDLNDPRDRRDFLNDRLVGLPLSLQAHTLATYRELADGWTETPPGIYTDVYFAKKFVSKASVTCRAGARPTVLYFPRGTHPGWSTARRYAELLGWHTRLADPSQVRAIRDEMYQVLVRDRLSLHRQWRWLSRVLAMPSAVINWVKRSRKFLRQRWSG
jgi:glycosyltransferase involved in cell wall biosynthesis